MVKISNASYENEIYRVGILSSAEARVTNSNNYPILRREPLPDATPSMAAIRGM